MMTSDITQDFNRISPFPASSNSSSQNAIFVQCWDGERIIRNSLFLVKQAWAQQSSLTNGGAFHYAY